MHGLDKLSLIYQAAGTYSVRYSRLSRRQVHNPTPNSASNVQRGARMAARDPIASICPMGLSWYD